MQNNKIRSTDLTALNRNWGKTILDSLLIGKITDFKIFGSPIITFIKDFYSYNTKRQGVQYLAESEIRFIDEYTYSRGKLFAVYQIIIPNLSHEKHNVIEGFNNEFSDFLQTIEKYKELDLFWYDRGEKLSDYNYYFQQLDQARNNVQFFTGSGKEHSDKLRNNLEKDLLELIQLTEARTRECFLLVSVSLNTLEDVEKAKELLTQKIQKLTNSLRVIKIGHRSIDSIDLDWLFSNFVSHKTMY